MYSKTAIVYKYPFDSLPNNKTKDDYYYRLRNCDTNLTSNTPANQYQRLKLIKDGSISDLPMQIFQVQFQLIVE